MVVDLNYNTGKDLFVNDYPTILVLFDLFHYFVQLRVQAIYILRYGSPCGIDLAYDLVRVGLGMKPAMGFNLVEANQFGLFGRNSLF